MLTIAGAKPSIPFFEIAVVVIPVWTATAARPVITTATTAYATTIIALPATAGAAVIPSTGIIVPGTEVLAVSAGAASPVVVAVSADVFRAVFYKWPVIEFQLTFSDGS